MVDVFISYAREESTFVRRLYETLIADNRSIQVDWQIPGGEDWWREIERNIQDADTFLCTISENWLTSEMCHRELQHAREHNKRIVPLIRQKIDNDLERCVKGVWVDSPWEAMARANWKHIQSRNWIFFDADAKFEGQFLALLKTLDEDQPYIKAHTRYQKRALDWQGSARNPSFLMWSDELTFAENWLIENNHQIPEPTDLQREYFAASRLAENEEAQEKARKDAEDQQRVRSFFRVTVGLSVMALVAVAAFTLAFMGGTRAQQDADNAYAQVIEVNTLVAQTLTPLGYVLQTGEAQITQAGLQLQIAGTEQSLAEQRAADANATLAPISLMIATANAEFAESEAHVESLRLSVLANSELDRNNARTASLLGISALNSTYTPEADAALFNALDANDVGLDWAGNISGVRNASYSADGALVVTANSNNAIIWDTESETQLRILSGHARTVNSATFSPDRNSIVTASDDPYAIVWNVSTGEQVSRLAHNGPVHSAVYSPLSGTFILTTSGSSAIIWVWDTDSWEQVSTLDGHSGEMRSAVYSPDEQFILTTQGTTPIVWDVATGTQSRTLMGQITPVLSAVYSPDGQFIAASSQDGTVMVWNAETGIAAHVLRGHTGVNSVVYSPDGQFILTASQDGRATVWDVAAEEAVRVLQGHEDSIYSAVYSPDGEYIITAGRDNRVILWQADYHDFVDYACESFSTPPNYTANERKIFDIREEAPPCE